MSIVYYQGERIHFRPIEPNDEPKLRQWINDPRIWSTLSHRPPTNVCREREWIDNLGKDDKHYNFGIVVSEDDRLIGSCGLHLGKPHARRAGFGIMIGDVDAQNQGYGSEAVQLAVRFGFEEINLNRIELSVLGGNDRAMRCYEKAGFVREGCRRQQTYRHGKFIDVYVYGILRDEWEVAQRDRAQLEPASC